MSLKEKVLSCLEENRDSYLSGEQLGCTFRSIAGSRLESRQKTAGRRMRNHSCAGQRVPSERRQRYSVRICDRTAAGKRMGRPDHRPERSSIPPTIWQKNWRSEEHLTELWWQPRNRQREEAAWDVLLNLRKDRDFI